MTEKVTIVITPRDRYSELIRCVRSIYEHTDIAMFELVILDLGYPRKDLNLALQFLRNRDNYRVLNLGLIIPMEAMDRVRVEIQTPHVIFMDNDSRPLEGWLPPLLETAGKTGAAVVSPVILESRGVDEGAELRTHLFSTELRVIEIEDIPYLLEHKTHRRELPENLPVNVTETQAFELHCVMFDSAVLRSLEIPRMTIREHLDLGMQLRLRNLKLCVEPRSRVIFDNLGTRANLSDVRYFDSRWNGQITERSSRLFEKRWGYKFYSEEAIYNWALRRRIFLLLRWLHFPISVANMFDRIFSGIRRRLKPVWDPVDDPIALSQPFYEVIPNGSLEQLDHSENLD